MTIDERPAWLSVNSEGLSVDDQGRVAHFAQIFHPPSESSSALRRLEEALEEHAKEKGYVLESIELWHLPRIVRAYPHWKNEQVDATAP